MGRIKQKEEEEEKARRRARDRFTSLLRHSRGINADTTWEVFEKDYGSEKEFKEVSFWDQLA